MEKLMKRKRLLSLFLVAEAALATVFVLNAMTDTTTPSTSPDTTMPA